jgi:conjugation system TraG family ATPase
MEKELDEILPVWAADADGILSVTGAYTIGFEVTKPEIFTLAAVDYEQLHGALLKALRVLPKGTILHFQDWYERRRYEPFVREGQSFLEAASDRHFAGRPWLEHRAYLFISKIPAGRRESSSAGSTLLRRHLVPEELLDAGKMRAFADIVSQFAAIAGSGKGWGLRRLGSEDLWSTGREPGLLERYCYLSGHSDGAIRDISFASGIRIGSRHCQLFTLAEASRLPACCAVGIRHDKYSTDGSPFVTGYSSPLGLLLDCNHIYNQYIFITDTEATLREMEKRRLRLESLSKASRGNAMARDAVNDFLNQVVREQQTPVRAHFNVLGWSDDAADWRDVKNKVSRAMVQVDVYPHEETVGAPQIWWAGIPGNAPDLPMNETFDCVAEQALCLITLESNYVSAPRGEGIRFCDRISGRPLWIDLFDEPRASGVATNMGVLVCGSSGGGKSMAMNHIVRTLHEQGAHALIVDIGGSYRGLCELVGGYYFAYEEKNPIRFNPFWLGGGALDTEKKESLKSLLVALWKQEHETYNRSEYIALSNALQGYYTMLAGSPEVYPCFDSFYEYLKTHYAGRLLEDGVKDADFDMNNFLYVLRPYYRGGEFDWLLNARENLNVLGQPFIVMELDTIKDHPILFPVVTLLLMEMFISKMRRLETVRKLLVIDEAWKAIAKPGMAEFLRYAVKTIRKLNGVPAFITQELDDLVDSPIIKDAIVSNCDIKILMDMRKFAGKFDKIQGGLGLSEKEKAILFSVDKQDRELYIGIGGQRMKVVRNELSPEEYFAYTTEGRERVKVREYAERYGSMEKGIEALVAERVLDK